MPQKRTALIFVLALLLFASCVSLPGARRFTWQMILEFDQNVPDREATLKQTIEAIQRRLDLAGVTGFAVEPEVTSPNSRIVVKLPEVSDRDRLKRLITVPGSLQLVAVVSPANPFPVQIYSTRETALAYLGKTIPENRLVLPYPQQTGPSPADLPTGQHANSWVVVETPALLDGSELRQVSAAPESGGGDYSVFFSLKPEGAHRLATWTRTHINDYLGVVLNGEVKSIAYIKSEISDQGEISGAFTKESAEDLALVLNAGSLPAAISIVSEGIAK